METQCFHKKLEIQRYQPKISVPLVTSVNLLKKCFKLFKNPEKIIPGAILGQERPEKNLAKCLFEAARLRVLDIDRQKQRLRDEI